MLAAASHPSAVFCIGRDQASDMAAVAQALTGVRFGNVQPAILIGIASSGHRTCCARIAEQELIHIVRRLTVAGDVFRQGGQIVAVGEECSAS